MLFKSVILRSNFPRFSCKYSIKPREWNKILNSYANPSSSQKSKERHQEKEEDEEEDLEMIEEWETKRRVKVFDRFTIILQIFAKRARSRVAKLQVNKPFECLRINYF